MTWGVEKTKGRAFRPAMQLSTGELASLGGLTLLQTATASCKTIRIMQAEFPEIKSWKKILSVPYRPNVSVIIPPTSVISGRFQDLLDPFVKRMMDFGEQHLIIVRSINSGIEIYFHLLKRLGLNADGKKTVAFYQRNSSQKRKLEILQDLRLPLNHPEKKLLATVATVSLSVGVDIRVKNVVCFGLGSTPEEIVQESGRCMRGNKDETANLHGLAFFFQKGHAAAIHCPPSSECRALIADPLPPCQTVSLIKFFDPGFDISLSACKCCYSCRSRDASMGCETCCEFLDLYLPKKKSRITSRTVLKEVKVAVLELFRGLGMSYVQVESRLQLSLENFSKDFIKAFDEISGPEDIMELWHVSEEVAENLYSVCLEVLGENEDFNELFEDSSSGDVSYSSESSAVDNLREESSDGLSSEDSDA
jgi:hypothetical protein